MYVRLLFPLVSCLVLSQGAMAECSAPATLQDSWSDTSPTEEAFAALEAKRFPEAALALKRAGKDPMALYMLGCMYRYGSLGEPDIPRAIESLELAAQANCVEAAAALAEIRDDLATEASESDLPRCLEDLEEALYLSFVLGTETASTDLALLFTPPGPGSSAGKALAWALIAEEAGVMGGAQLRKELSAAHPEAVFQGENQKRDLLVDVEAARAKAGGLVQIQLPIELFFPEGKAPKGSGGGSGNSPAFDAAFAAYQGDDYQTALLGFQPMADAGDPASCFYVGRILEMGFAGTKDEAGALRWYRQSAAGGINVAMSNIGYMLMEGRGAKKDPGLATDFFLMAAYAGAVDGAINIGFAYGTGTGRNKDVVEAHAWYGLAAGMGEEVGAKNLAAIEGEMNPIQIANGKTRLKELEQELRGERSPKYPVPTPLGSFGEARGTSQTRERGQVPDTWAVEEKTGDFQGPGPDPQRVGDTGAASFTFKDRVTGGMPSHTVQLPAGWTMEGGVSWNPQDANACVSVDAVMGAQDGTQVQFLPDGSFMYFTEMDMPDAPPRPQEGQYKDGSMFLNPGSGPEDFVTRVILRSYRPNAQNVKVVSSGEAAPVSQVYSDLLAPMIEQMAQNSGQSGIQTTHKVYCPLIRVSYTEAGQSFDEEFSFMYMRVDMTGQMQPGKSMTSTFWSVFEARGLRAPAGRLDPSLGMLRGLAASLEPTQDWSCVVDGLNTNVFANPEAFQKLQSKGYEGAMSFLEGEASKLTASMDQTRASGQETWNRIQDAGARVRKAWAQLSGVAVDAPRMNPDPTTPAPRRGGFRIR